MIKLFDSKTYALIALSLILSSICFWVLEAIDPILLENISIPVDLILNLILLVFFIEYIVRIADSVPKFRYAVSMPGIIDLMSILPSILLLITGVGVDSIWLRLLRASRFVRIVMMTNKGRLVGGISGACMPMVALAVMGKAVVIGVESVEWWVIDPSINILLGVSGFSIAMLMGSKLSSVNGRLYALEDAVCRITGSMRDMWWATPEIRRELAVWSSSLEHFLQAPREEKLRIAPRMRNLTDDLEKTLENYKLGGPNISGFHRDAAFLIHRATATTPIAYDQFLRYVSILYIIIQIIAIPGLIGLISIFLSSFIILGIYYLVSDMDDPLNYQTSSFIDARLDALTYWNQNHPVDEQKV